MKKDVVAGIGEIGKPILKLLSKQNITVGFDLKPDLMNQRIFEKYKNLKISFLHIAIPATSRFSKNVLKLSKKFQPECIVIHSTIQPKTTSQLQSKFKIPVIYSATRGVHKRMLHDLKRYTKFFAISSKAPKKHWAARTYSRKMKNCGVKIKQMSKPETLELAKILCDTSYLGWLINYSQLTNVIAKSYNVNYDEMWLFSDEIHKFLDNRPKMYPGYIGGHCVIPNLELIHDKTLNLIKTLNDSYLKKVKNSKSIKQKYLKHN